jgi:hypothetical protein
MKGRIQGNAERWVAVKTTKAGPPNESATGFLIDPRAGGGNASGGFCPAASKLLAEFLDPPGFDDALLSTGVKRVRFGCDVKLKEWILVAIVHLDGFAGIDGRPGNEFEPARHVKKHYLAVGWVNAVFHGSNLRK